MKNSTKKLLTAALAASLSGSLCFGAFAGTRDLSVYKTFTKNRQAENFVMSTYSLFDVLSLLYDVSGGKTRQEFTDAFGFTEETAGEYRKADSAMLFRDGYGVAAANRAFINENEQNKIRVSALNGIGSELIPMNQTGTDKINAFVNENTHSMIPKLLDSLSGNEIAVLVNTLYFHKKWIPEGGYDALPTGILWADGKRYPGFSGEIPLCDFKEATGDIDVFRIPYSTADEKEHRYSLVLFTDREGAETGKVLDYVSSLSDEELEALVTFNGCSADYAVRNGVAYEDASFRMPAFTSSMKDNLTQGLKDLGFRTAFTDAADFSALGSLEISDVLQAAKIKVDREGTEAAAATGISMRATCARDPLPTKHLVAEKPFFYVLRDETAEKDLFMGQVVLPSAEQE